jgi:hypothetical protein
VNGIPGVRACRVGTTSHGEVSKLLEAANGTTRPSRIVKICVLQLLQPLKRSNTSHNLSSSSLIALTHAKCSSDAC